MADNKSKDDDQAKSTAKATTSNDSSQTTKSTTDKTEPMRYTKHQFVSMSSFPGPKRDLYQISLEEGKEYTVEEANAAVAAVIERMWS